MRPLRVLLLFLCSVALTASGQKYGNEWVNFSQKYFKFPVLKEGIYKIDSTTLSNYFDLTTINPKNFQVFIRGKEQFLYVQGESDNKVNTNDFIEFYADGLSAPVDSLLYHKATYQPNPYVSLVNDTLYAFITLNNSLNNKRYSVETDVNFGAYSQASYFYHDKIWTPNNTYGRAIEFAEDGSNPIYTLAEAKGYQVYDDPTGPTNVPLINSLALKVYTLNASLPVILRYNGGGTKKTDQYVDHRFKLFYSNSAGNNVLLTDTTFSGATPFKQSFTLSPTDLGNTCNITFSACASTQFTCGYDINNRVVVFYTGLYYPQTLDLGGNYFYKGDFDNNTSQNKGSYTFSNFSAGASVEMMDLTNGRYIQTVVNGNQVQAVIPNGPGRKQCVLMRSDSVYKVTALRKIGSNGYFIDYGAQQASKPFVIIYPGQFASSAGNYVSYRQGPGGGSYDVVQVNADYIYDQFSYGVNKHPIAIKNLIRLLNDKLPSHPKYVLLIGHAAHNWELDVFPEKNLLPTYGAPGSDILFTSALSDTNVYVPEIPIGRVAALTNKEVLDYLDKVKTHESTSDTAAWKKKVLHFAGGDDELLVKTLLGYTNIYKSHIQDTLFGATVTSFTKSTNAPIQTNISDSVFRIINQGCSILTFFGHGSLASFDQAIDNLDKYYNTGRYPFLIANSCNSGDIFYPRQDGRSVSESFLLAPKKGSIGFVATTSFGQDVWLFNYTDELYKSIAATKYGQGLGDAIKEVCYKCSTHEMSLKMVALDMAFHGDPSIKVNVGSKPDYQVLNRNVSFDLKKYTDSVGVSVVYNNTGPAKNTNITVKIVRYFPNGDSATTYKLVKAPYYSDTIKFYSPIDFNRGFGLNRFSVKVDYFNQVAELSESNNSTNGTVDLFITGGDIYPVYPFKYAVVPKTGSVVIKASTSDPFAPLTNYRFQLDTCDKFISPIQSTVITSKGGVIEWPVNLTLGDSTVYFWRVSRDSTDPLKPFVWRESSFQTIGNKRGWSQAHFNQFKSDDYQFVNYKKDLRKFAFENSVYSINCRDGLPSALYYYSISYFFNSIRMSEFGCAWNGWNIALFDSISRQPIRFNAAYEYGYATDNNYAADSICLCGTTQAFANFGSKSNCDPYSSSTWRTHLESFLNKIPVNTYALIYSLGYDGNYSYPTSFSNSLYNQFESFGAKTIRTVSDTVPYILFGRKGMSVGQGNELVGKNKSFVLNFMDSLKTRWKDGYVASEKIGPSSKWNSLHWRVQSLDNGLGDTTILKVVGYNPQGTADTLAIFKQDTPDVLDLSNYVNANNYPYIKLVAFMRDKIYSTSPQLKRWQVLYDEAPECAINPLKGFSTINDTLMEGDVVNFRFPIENIGVASFGDSLAISYWIEDNQHNKVLLADKFRRGSFDPGKVIIDTVKINSFKLRGNNSLWINVNPVRHRKYQREQYLFNNVGNYSFKVNGDITNPLLDVTFDGVRILNGDIVSARPNILITLKDENKFLALNDTNAFSVSLQAPGQSSPKRVYFGPSLVFTPAELPNNSCQILYSPSLPSDGKYTLIVQARDRSNNASGYQDYRIQFEVDNKPGVTGVLNYPNPFTTSTRFVFTLTGSEIPEVFTIQIMTISGKVVREITRSELGYLHIGRNITEYAWDGKDQYGDRLANGVYLYRVITRLNGVSLEKNASEADKYFVKEYGKMVLVR